MERKWKIGMLLLGIFLLVSGWYIEFTILHYNSMLGDLLDAWHLPAMLIGILWYFSVIALPSGASLLVYLLLPANSRINSYEISYLVFGVVAIYAFVQPLFVKHTCDGQPSCANNQRRLAMAFNISAQDNRERLPPGWDSIKLAPYDLICPSTQRRFHSLPPGGYGVNAYLLGKHLNEINDPTTQMLTMDAKQMTSLIHSSNDIAFRHEGAYFASFLDGHTGYITDMGKVQLQLNEQAPKKLHLPVSGKPHHRFRAH